MNFHYDIEHQFAQIFVQCFSFLDVNEKGIFFTKYVSSFYSKYAPLIIVWVSSKDRIITYVDIWLVCGLANHQVKGIRGEEWEVTNQWIVFDHIIYLSPAILNMDSSMLFFFMCGS